MVENLKVMLTSEAEDPAEQECSLKMLMLGTECQLLAGLPEALRFSVQELLRLARAYTALDDIEHYQTTRLTLPFRRGLRALGEALQAQGIVGEAMDVFFAKAEMLAVAVEQAQTGNDLSGLPGSPGCASGPVYKVLSADDFADFPSGAILVARTTNPAWTPLFYNAAAVVTESDGPLSHGAVTAREIGLPAMSVCGVLDALNNGDRVRVDGSSGRVSSLG